MKLTFTNEITFSSGFYYSPAFVVDAKDDLITVECTLVANGTAIIQSSIDGINWYDVADSSFSCAPNGLQSYADCQTDLLYRVKSSTSFTWIKILI